MDSQQLQSERDIFLYQETLGYYREKAKEQLAAANDPALQEHLFKQFCQMDGAIQILNWVLKIEGINFNLPPIASRGAPAADYPPTS